MWGEGKKVKRKLVVSDTSLYMGSTEAGGQPRRVQLVC